MEELAEASASPAAPSSPFAFGAESSRPLAAIPPLDRVSQRAARLLRQRLEPLSRVKPRVVSDPVAVRSYESWKADQPEFTSLSLYRFRPLKGGLLLSIEPELIGRFVDAYYGGPGIHGERVLKEFSPTEERLLARLSEAVIETMTEVWTEVMPVEAQLTSRETSTAHAGLMVSDDPVAVARFTISVGQGRSGRIEIVYPVASLRAIEAQLSTTVQDDGGISGVEWRERMCAALGEVRVQARSVLARPTLSLSELLRLQPGDVIPISLPGTVPLLVSGRTIAIGTIGEQDGRAALKIEKVHNRRSVQ